MAQVAAQTVLSCPVDTAALCPVHDGTQRAARGIPVRVYYAGDFRAAPVDIHALEAAAQEVGLHADYSNYRRGRLFGRVLEQRRWHRPTGSRRAFYLHA